MTRKSNYDKLVDSIRKALSVHPDVVRFHEEMRADVQELQPLVTEETPANRPEVYGEDFDAVDLEIDLGDDDDPFSLINLKK